jgi:FtsP/CotA-like multicopper oxidase with cupredoxin domain
MSSQKLRSRRSILGGTASIALAATCTAAVAQDPARRPSAGSVSAPGRAFVRPRPVNPTPTPRPPGPIGDTVVGNFRYTPFTVPLPIPEIAVPVGIGTPPFTPGDVFHGIAPEYFNRRSAESHGLPWFQRGPEKYYEIRMRQGVHEIIPGVKTPIFGYEGIYPGKTIRSRVGQPLVVRFWNDLPVETSVHMHGAHTPAHSDG